MHFRGSLDYFIHTLRQLHQDMNGGTMTTCEKVDQRLPPGISLTSTLTGRKCRLAVSCPHEFKLTRRPAALMLNATSYVTNWKMALTIEIKNYLLSASIFKAAFFVFIPPSRFKLIARTNNVRKYCCKTGTNIILSTVEVCLENHTQKTPLHKVPT